MNNHATVFAHFSLRNCVKIYCFVQNESYCYSTELILIYVQGFTKAKMCDLWRNEQSCSSICSCSMPKCTSGSFVCTQSNQQQSNYSYGVFIIWKNKEIINLISLKSIKKEPKMTMFIILLQRSESFKILSFLKETAAHTEIQNQQK